MINDRIEREIYIAAPVSRVWAVITEPEHVGMWFGEGEPAEIDLRPGGRIVFDHGVHGKLPAVIERLDEPKRFAFRWAADDTGGREPTEVNSTLVEFSLEPEPDGDREGTRLRVTESGFSTVIAEPDVMERRYKANKGGWSHALVGLAEYTKQEVELADS